MWSIQTTWFDVATRTGVFEVGNILFGHFEEGRPMAQRLLKVALAAGVTVALSCAALRWAAYELIGAFGLAAACVHIWWLPSHEINCWTSEPRAKYPEQIAVRRRGREREKLNVTSVSGTGGRDPNVSAGGPFE